MTPSDYYDRPAVARSPPGKCQRHPIARERGKA